MYSLLVITVIWIQSAVTIILEEARASVISHLESDKSQHLGVLTDTMAIAAPGWRIGHAAFFVPAQ